MHLNGIIQFFEEVAPKFFRVHPGVGEIKHKTAPWQ